MISLILVLLALAFAMLALFAVPSRVSWTAAGLLCLALLHLLNHLGHA